MASNPNSLLEIATSALLFEMAAVIQEGGWDILQLPVPTFETVTSRVANLWEIPLQPNSPFKFGGGFEVLNL